jgi:predicted choloylglycine hydrolase
MIRSVERQQTVLKALDDPATTLSELIARFLELPLYSRSAEFTAYTAVYRPAEGRVDYLWPVKAGASASTSPTEYTSDYGERAS